MAKRRGRDGPGPVYRWGGSGGDAASGGAEARRWRAGSLPGVPPGRAGQLPRAREGASGQRREPEDQGPSGWTALHWAAYYGNDALVRLLLDRGANVNARTASETGVPDMPTDSDDECPLQTPPFAAAARGRVSTVRLLLARGANPRLSDPRYGTALHCAAAEGEAGAATLLLKAGADPNSRTERGETPLHWAVQREGLDHRRMYARWMTHRRTRRPSRSARWWSCSSRAVPT